MLQLLTLLSLGKKVPGSIPGLVVGPFCMEFVCSPNVGVGFSRCYVSSYSSTSHTISDWPHKV